MTMMVSEAPSLKQSRIVYLLLRAIGFNQLSKLTNNIEQAPMAVKEAEIFTQNQCSCSRDCF